MASSTKQRRRPVSWEKDGVNGGPSSVDVILKWITAEGNLQRWRGDTVGGKTKKALASEIADLIKQAGIKGREYKGVLQKVNDIQDSYNKTADLKRQSGEGVLDEDEAKTFHDKLVGICKHWDVLDPVFHNRSSSRPIAPTGTFKNAPPFVITSARENTEDGHFDLDHPDLFPFGENAFPESEEEADAAPETTADLATSTSGRSRDVEVTSQSAGEATCTGSGPNAAETADTASVPSHNSEDRNSAPATSRTTATNGTKGGSKRNKPLTLKSMPQKRRKSLDDVMYESICERTIIAQKRSCIEMAQAKIKFTKDLLELGIYSTDEVKAMVAEHFGDK